MTVSVSPAWTVISVGADRSSLVIVIDDPLAGGRAGGGAALALAAVLCGRRGRWLLALELAAAQALRGQHQAGDACAQREPAIAWDRIMHANTSFTYGRQDWGATGRPSRLRDERPPLIRGRFHRPCVSAAVSDLTPVRAGRTLWRTHDRQPRASSMPQTTIYAAPRRWGARADSPPAVATHELARLFGGSAALAGVSLRVAAGRTIALLGPNGAGKTTLLRILATALRPSFGTRGGRGDRRRRATRPRPPAGRLPLARHRPVRRPDRRREPGLRRHHAAPGRTPRASGGPRRWPRWGSTADADRRVRGFSAGMRRRLALGRLLLHGRAWCCWTSHTPRSTPMGMALMDRLLQRWREAGVTVLVASHQAERVARLADGWRAARRRAR